MKYIQSIALSFLLVPVVSYAWLGGIDACPISITGTNFENVRIPHIKEDKVFVEGALSVDGYNWFVMAEARNVPSEKVMHFIEEQAALATPFYNKPKYINGAYECRYSTLNGTLFFLYSK